MKFICRYALSTALGVYNVKKIWYIDSKKVIRQHLTLKCSTSCVQTIKIEDIYLHSIEI